MFNKELNKIQLTDSSLKVFEDLYKDPWFGSQADYNEAYIRRYFMPKIFLPRNKKIAEKFVSNNKLFGYTAKLDLLKECDLTDFIVEHKDELEKYPFLFRFASGYKMSDEAAWVLMENCQFEPIYYTTIVNIHSIWFRPFENEDTTSVVFKKRLQRAVRWRNHYLKEKFNEKEEKYYSLQVFDVSQRILNFHLGTAFISPIDAIFGGYISQTMNQDYPTVDLNTLYWMLSNQKPSELYMCAAITPVLLYADDVPEGLFPHVQEAKTLIHDLCGDEIKCRKWKELLGDERFDLLITDYPDLMESSFVTNKTMWEEPPATIIGGLISAYQGTNKNLLDKSKVKLLRKTIKKQLEGSFNIQIESTSLEQLISIYKSSSEGEQYV